MTNQTNTAASTKVKNVITKEQLTVDILKAYVFLDEASGYFYANKDTVRNKVGDFVGQLNIATGLYKVQIAGTIYGGKDLAHFYKTGEWNPELAPRRGRAAPGEAKAPKEKKVHVPRTAPVITEEAIAKAKADMAAKKAALKAKKDAAAAAAQAQAE